MIEWMFKQICASKKMEFNKKDNGLLVWGCGQLGKKFNEILSCTPHEVTAYMDTNKDKQGTTYYDKYILEPSNGLKMYPDADVVVAMSKDKAANIIVELRESGRNAMSMLEYFIGCFKQPLSILEIGPWYTPFFRGANVKYFDVITSEGLRNKANRFNLPIDNIPEKIDFVSPNGSWKCVKENFDLIYSSHVIEHQTDFIRHLQEAEGHINPGGAYVLVIPDKRYCFNYFDPETTLEDVLTAYLEKRTRHSIGALLRGFSATHNDVLQHWEGNHGCRKKYSKGDIDRIANEYFKSLEGEYVDAHEWFFTPDSFNKIINQLIDVGLLSFSRVEIRQTEFNTNSFGAYLEK